MAQLSFWLNASSDADFQRRRKIRHLKQAAVVSVVTAAAIYGVENPGEIRITQPADGVATNASVVALAGEVENPRIDTITLNVNGAARTVPVAGGKFAASVPLIPGENTIQATAGGIVANFSGGSNIVRVPAEITPAAVWTELTWDGPGDIDLHLYLPNGEHCFFDNKTTRAGAKLDVDNTTNDGPEHIIMENPLTGPYRISVLYFASASRPARPVSWQVTVRLKNNEIRHFSGRLYEEKEEQDVYAFSF
ncbi:MAG TPA: hypothetical protein VNH44_02110 [Micropepsaceae bacterium]|nr:hypothetical protein [Micropepsaceae bacterium]